MQRDQKISISPNKIFKVSHLILRCYVLNVEFD